MVMHNAVLNIAEKRDPKDLKKFCPSSVDMGISYFGVSFSQTAYKIWKGQGFTPKTSAGQNIILI